MCKKYYLKVIYEKRLEIYTIGAYLGKLEDSLISVTGQLYDDNKISQVTVTCITVCLHYFTRLNRDLTLKRLTHGNLFYLINHINNHVELNLHVCMSDTPTTC